MRLFEWALENAEKIAALFAVVPTGIAVGVWVWRRLKSELDDRSRWLELSDRSRWLEAQPILLHIASEFRPNGGGSLRDVIDALRVEVASAHDELHADRAERGALMRLLDQALFRADIEGRCLWVSRSWSRITGLTKKDAAGFGWLASVHPDDRERVRHDWLATVASGGDFIVEMRVVPDPLREPDEILRVRCTATRVGDGAKRGFIGRLDILPEVS